MFDCHMHTKFSTDSVMNAEDACEAAVKYGLKGIAFTDHLDIDYPGEESFLIDFDQYFKDISDVQKTYSEKLKVLKAVEVGIQPHVLEDSLKIVNNYPFDYVLASIHVVDGIDPYRREYYMNKSKKEAYERYLNEIFFLIQHFKSFDMVGHFEYIIRYANYDNKSLRYADHSDLFDSIMKELIYQGRGFEVNTGTYRNPMPDVEYDVEVLKRYRQLGGELICLSSDAHRTEHIGMHFDFYTQMLRDAGFGYTVHFEDRKAVFDKI